MHSDPFGARTPLGAGLPSFYRLEALHKTGPVPALDLGELPVTVKILLENVLRHAGGGIVREQDVAALAGWKPGAWATTDIEIPFTPGRVILQDFTGVPAV
ncbi:MAG: aconitate hydratase, partial [Candidatus Limnocylindrales bacterium]